MGPVYTTFRVVIGVSVVSVFLSAGEIWADPAPLPQQVSPVKAPPQRILVTWQPLRPNVKAPVFKRPPLRAAVRGWRAGRHKRACIAVDQYASAALRHASTLFYAPTRKGAKLSAIERYWARYLNGPSAFLEVRQESFVLTSDALALLVDACARAGQWAPVARWTAPRALTAGWSRASVAYVLARWALDDDLRPVSSWIDRASRSTPTALLRLQLMPRSRQAAALGDVARRALRGEAPLVKAVTQWMEATR